MIVDIQSITGPYEGSNTQGQKEKLQALRISYIDKDGEIAFKDMPLQSKDAFSWVYATSGDRPEPRYKSWDRRAVRAARTNRLSKFRVEELLMERKDEVAEVFEFNVPKKFVIDIETEVTDGFPDAEQALNRVTAISIVNCADKKCTVLAIKPLEDGEEDAIQADIDRHFEKYKEDKWAFSFFAFDSEYDMLYSFFAKFIHKMPCMTGWNISGYDWPYLVNRADRLKIDPGLSSSSGILVGKDRLPQHRMVIDYLPCVKKWDRVIKIKENFKLDYIGEQCTGITKVKYSGTLKDLYEKDYQKFIFYNAVDSILVHYIDKKLNTLNTFFTQAHVTNVEYNRVFSPVSVQDALMCREFYKRGFVMVDEQKNVDQKPFEGAYVKHPLVGFHEWVACFDFASLYPNTMMQFNISPETYLGKSPGGTVGEGQIMTANGSLFDGREDSVLRTILADIYGRRVESKTEMKQINVEIDNLERLLAA